MPSYAIDKMTSNPSALELRDVLRAAGMRATAARIAVLKLLKQSNTPLSHAEVVGQLQQDGFDRATLYRNLVDLADSPLARRSDLGDHVWRFEAVGDGEHKKNGHPHFVCSDCGIVECLPTEAIAVQSNLKAASKLGRAGVEIQIRGICDECV